MIAGNHVLRRQSRRRSASPFGNQDVAIGKDEGLARDLKIGGNGRDRVALRYRGSLVAPFRRVRNLHGGEEPALRIRELRIRPVLRRFRIAAAGGQKGREGDERE